MGQKVNPHGLRVGVNKEWSSSWIANKKEFSNYLIEEQLIQLQAQRPSLVFLLL